MIRKVSIFTRFATFKLLVMFMLFTLQATNIPAFAEVQNDLNNQAEKAYTVKDYTLAARLYETIVKQNVDNKDENFKSNTFYNLGNCYFRLKDYPHAVLNYQRAIKASPSNEDAAFNLELTQAKLADHFDTPSEMFFVTWTKALISEYSADQWGRIALALLTLSFISLLAYKLFNKIIVRKIGLVCSCSFLLCMIICYIFATIQGYSKTDDELFVILRETPTFSSPSVTSPRIRDLNEGTTIKVIDTYNKQWLQIQMPDGKTAWAKSQTLEKV